MKIVLEVGDWVLAEDDEGEVRLWSNGVTGETRSYQDLPPEVEAALGSEDGPPLHQPSAQASPPQPQAPPDDAAPSFMAAAPQPAAPAAAPFRRSCGVAAAPATDTSAFAGAVGAGRAAPADPLPVARSAPLEISASVPQQGYGWEEPSMVGGTAVYCDEACEESGPFPSAAPGPLTSESRPAPAPEPEPVVARPLDLVDGKLKEPTPAMLVKATSMKLYQGQSQSQFLAKLTHIHMAGKGLTSLGDTFNTCPMLRVLNLENNHLQELANIRPRCEVLHLQGNDVWDLGSWTQNLTGLTSLNLTENRLSMLSGLSKSNRLEDLNLRSQRSDLPLQLHPPTLRAFSRSLRSLDISRNRMSDIGAVASLVMLQRLDASCNMLTEMPSVSCVLQQLTRLSRLCLEENPISWMQKYRDMIILAAPQCLEEFDRKTVQPNERPFLMELHQRRRRRNSSEPPRKGRSGGGSPSSGSSQAGVAPEGRSASLGMACPPRPPCDNAPTPGCGNPGVARHRSRSSSIDPRRRRSSGATKLPPLPPRAHLQGVPA